MFLERQMERLLWIRVDKDVFGCKDYPGDLKKKILTCSFKVCSTLHVCVKDENFLCTFWARDCVFWSVKNFTSVFLSSLSIILERKTRNFHFDFRKKKNVKRVITSFFFLHTKSRFQLHVDGCYFPSEITHSIQENCHFFFLLQWMFLKILLVLQWFSKQKKNGFSRSVLWGVLFFSSDSTENY